VEIDKDSSPAAASLAGFTGELDELQIAKTARPAGFIQFAATNQGTSADAAKLLVVGSDVASDHEEESEIMKHLTLITDISKDLTFDGWVVIFLCTLLAIVGWIIAAGKIMYLNTIEKASKEFMKRWEKISSDLTAIDHEDTESVKNIGGTVSNKMQKLMRQSPLYQLYHLGSEEISHRMKSVREITLDPKEKKERQIMGLSGRSIQAIKAVLHGGMVREVQKLNGKLVFLTIGIAGGPYLGLLGTVIGVMITFAVIAKVRRGGGELDRSWYRGRSARHGGRSRRRHPGAVYLQLPQLTHQGRGLQHGDLHRRVRREDGRALQGVTPRHARRQQEPTTTSTSRRWWTSTWCCC
jgi:biopolymer transport protein ExbB